MSGQIQMINGVPVPVDWGSSVQVVGGVAIPPGESQDILGTDDIIEQLEKSADLQRQITSSTYASYTNSNTNQDPFLSSLTATEGKNSQLQNINATLANNEASVEYNSDLQNSALQQRQDIFDSTMGLQYEQMQQKFIGNLLGAGGAVLGGYLGGRK